MDGKQQEPSTTVEPSAKNTSIENKNETIIVKTHTRRVLDMIKDEEKEMEALIKNELKKLENQQQIKLDETDGPSIEDLISQFNSETELDKDGVGGGELSSMSDMASWKDLTKSMDTSNIAIDLQDATIPSLEENNLAPPPLSMPRRMSAGLMDDVSNQLASPSHLGRRLSAGQLEIQLIMDQDYIKNLQKLAASSAQDEKSDNGSESASDYEDESHESKSKKVIAQASNEKAAEKGNTNASRPNTQIAGNQHDKPATPSASKKTEFKMELPNGEEKAKRKGHVVKGAALARKEMKSILDLKSFDLKGIKIRNNLLAEAEERLKKLHNDPAHIKDVFERLETQKPNQVFGTDDEYQNKAQLVERLSRIQADVAEHEKNLKSTQTRTKSLQRSSSAQSVRTKLQSKRTDSDWKVFAKKKQSSTLDILLNTFGKTRDQNEDGNFVVEDSVEKAEKRVLEAIARKVQLELDVILEKTKAQKTYQAQKKFALESGKAGINIFQRNIRDKKTAFPALETKKRHLEHYLNDTSKRLFKKEKERNQRLRRTILNIEKGHVHFQESLKFRLEDVVAIKEERLRQKEELDNIKRKMEFDINHLTSEIEFMKENMDKLSKRHHNLKVAKEHKLKELVEIDHEAREKELEIIEKALAKRRDMGVEVEDIKELETYDLEDYGISKIPLLDINPTLVRHLIVKKNKLKSLDINTLVALQTLDADKNAIEYLDLVELTKLKKVSIAFNNIKDLRGFNDSLIYLNISDNALVSIDGLETSPNIEILMMSNSEVKDFSGLAQLDKLLYLNISSSHLEDEIFAFTSKIRNLQYLDVSNNIIKSFPDMMNRSIYEINLSSNVMNDLKGSGWLFNLRVLNLSQNQIVDISPLTWCPFLKELNLSENLIRETVQLYHISICRELTSLNLRDNPVLRESDFNYIIATYFKSIKFLNGTALNSKRFGAKHKRYFTPLKAIIPIYDLISYFERYVAGSMATQTVRELELWKSFMSRKDQYFLKYQGEYISPYLSYILGNQDTSIDLTSILTAQEKKLDWLLEYIEQLTTESKILPEISVDTPIFHYIWLLNNDIKELRITYVQSLWKSRISKKKYQRIRNATFVIQRFFRRVRDCKSPRKLLRELWKKKKADEKAEAERLKLEASKNAMGKKLRNTKKNKMPVAEFMDKVDSDLEEDADIDEWARKVEAEAEDLFDKNMNSYLATEKLIYQQKSKQKQQKKREIKHKRPMKNYLEGNDDFLGESMAEMDKGIPKEGDFVPHHDILQTLRVGDKRKRMINQITDKFNTLPKGALPPTGVLSHADAILLKAEKANNPVNLIEHLISKYKEIHPEANAKDLAHMIRSQNLIKTNIKPIALSDDVPMAATLVSVFNHNRAAEAITAKARGDKSRKQQESKTLKNADMIKDVKVSETQETQLESTESVTPVQKEDILGQATAIAMEGIRHRELPTLESFSERRRASSTKRSISGQRASMSIANTRRETVLTRLDDIQSSSINTPAEEEHNEMTKPQPSKSFHKIMQELNSADQDLREPVPFRAPAAPVVDLKIPNSATIQQIAQEQYHMIKEKQKSKNFHVINPANETIDEVPNEVPSTDDNVSSKTGRASAVFTRKSSMLSDVKDVPKRTSISSSVAEFGSDVAKQIDSNVINQLSEIEEEKIFKTTVRSRSTSKYSEIISEIPESKTIINGEYSIISKRFSMDETPITITITDSQTSSKPKRFSIDEIPSTRPSISKIPNPHSERSESADQRENSRTSFAHEYSNSEDMIVALKNTRNSEVNSISSLELARQLAQMPFSNESSASKEVDQRYTSNNGAPEKRSTSSSTRPRASSRASSHGRANALLKSLFQALPFDSDKPLNNFTIMEQQEDVEESPTIQQEQSHPWDDSKFMNESGEYREEDDNAMSDTQEPSKGWSQYSEKTMELLKKSSKRIERLKKVAQEREIMKDPSKRLDAFQQLKDKLENELEKFGNQGSTTSLNPSLNGSETRKKKIAIPSVYEWDIHPGEVAQKLMPKSKPKKEIVKTISIVGSATEPKISNYISTDEVCQPQVTLLINNFVKAKIFGEPQNVIDPNTIHRVSSRQEMGPLSSRLGLVQSKIALPEYGTYDLTKHQPLPNIVKSNFH